MVTIETLQKYNTNAQPHTREFNKCLKEHMAFNDFLEERITTETRMDWGGKYATWLNNYGIDHQTENGWWNKHALNPDNYELFIKEQTSDVDDDFHNPLVDARVQIMKILKVGTLSTDKTVREIVEILTGYVMEELNYDS